MITVHTPDGPEEFPGKVGFATDEHNNLEVLTDPESSVAVFAEGYWMKAVMSDG